MKQLNGQNRQFRDIRDSFDARDCRQYPSSNSGQTHIRELRRQFLDLGWFLFLIPCCTGAPLPPTARDLEMAAAPSGNGTWERGRNGMHPSTAVTSGILHPYKFFSRVLGSQRGASEQADGDPSVPIPPDLLLYQCRRAARAAADGVKRLRCG